VAAPPIAAPKAATSLEGIKATLSQCSDAIVAAAALVREQNHANPWPYALRRAGMWLGVSELPPSEGTKTYVGAPSGRERADLEAHLNAERWLPLLNEAEWLTGQNIYWLDLHRYVSIALEKLGCAEAARTVARAVATFIDRFPPLPSLSFANNTPFANADTQAWIEQNRKSGGGGGAPDAIAEENAEQEKRLDAARQAIQEGRVGEGVGLMVALARRAPDGRGRFRTELAAARLAIDAQKPALARPILEGLVSQIDAVGLETWDPELCVSVYASLLNALRSTKPPIVDANRREAFIIEKICRLDPALAVRLGI
jgi:type VI secretion system protein VasJ